MLKIGSGLPGPTFKPRAHLECIDIPSTFELPSLDVVRREAVLLAKMKAKSTKGTVNAVFLGEKEGDPEWKGRLSEPLSWNAALPNLFKFAYFVRMQDIPEDLLEDVIWTLKMFVRVLTESSEESLRAVGHYLPNQTTAFSSYYGTLKPFSVLYVDSENCYLPQLSNTHQKLSNHLLNPVIDRPEEAVPYIEAGERDLKKRLREIKCKEPSWRYNPQLYSMLSHALVLSGDYSEETKTILEHVLEAADSKTRLEYHEFTRVVVRARTHLALVLQQLGVEPDKQEHVERIAKYVKKTPKILTAREWRQILKRPGRPINPVYEAIGGIEWIEESNLTSRQENANSKICRTCGGREPQKTLFRCSGCKHIFYCSRECQKANWKVHKEGCHEEAKEKEKLAELKTSDPKQAQKASDWIKWRQGTHAANTHCLAHALGLQRDPSRGRTHIVFRKVEYTPRASKDPRYRFRVARCGVFKIESVLNEIEMMMCLDKGEGREYVDSLIIELDSTHRSQPKIPILDLTFGEGIQTWLESMAITKDQLRALPYDPEWRREMNLGEPPEPVVLVSGVPDVEHVF